MWSYVSFDMFLLHCQRMESTPSHCLLRLNFGLPDDAGDSLTFLLTSVSFPFVNSKNIKGISIIVASGVPMGSQFVSKSTCHIY